MPNEILFENENHRNILLEDVSSGLAVQANQHVIIHGKSGMILDPGGHKVYSKVLSETLGLLNGAELDFLFLSHQDPDIVAAVNGWLMTTDADAYASALWSRFIPHFGLDSYIEDRLKPIPDEGMIFDLDGVNIIALPGHFLHSCGNFQLYDPVSKILYTGDLGASLGCSYRTAPSFSEHLQYMEGFHKRFMGSSKAIQAWAKMAKTMDIETIAPQHGAMMVGKEIVGEFIDWCSTLECGIDLMEASYVLPKAQ